MAGKKISYEVDVNAQDAISEFKKVGREAERAGKAIEKGLEVTPDTGKIDKFISNLKEAGEEAEQVGKAIQSIKKFAPEVDDSDLAALVLSLRKAGIEFDAIETKAKDLGDALKQVDSPKIKDLDTNLRTTAGGADQLTRSVGGSRSVLANMVGNATQDLGALAGVAQSAGVAIGQMGEYMADARLEGEGMGSVLKNFGTVVGPLAAISAGLALAQHIMGGIAKEKAFDKKEAEDFAEVIGEIGAGADAVLGHLQEIGGLKYAADSGLIGFGTTIKDVTGLLDKYGITASEVARVVAGSTAEQEAWFAALAASGVEVNDQAKIMEAIRQSIDGYNTGLERAEQTEAVFVSTTEDANTALQGLNETQGAVTDAWAAVLADMVENGRVTDNSIRSWNLLRDELDLTDTALAELADEKMAEQLEEDRQAAIDLAEAMGDLRDTIGEIDADDLGNIGGALQVSLDLGDQPIDFQSVKENLRDAFTDLGTFIEENPVDIDWSKVLDTSKDTGLSPELLGLITSIRDQFQTGITEAFEIGGAGAAQHFVDSFLPQLTALGMSPAQAYEFLGLPADGSVDVLLKPLVDAEAKADALAILESLQGVDPNNPILAYIRLGLQTGDIEPQIGEIAARLLAADALNVPAELEAFTQADVDAAVAVLAGYGITVPVTVDDEGTIQEFTDNADAATVDRTTNVIVPKSDSLGQMQELIDHVARARTVAFNAKADNAGQINDLLDHLARAREAAIRVLLPNYATVEYDLQFLARDRDSKIIVHTVSVGGGNTAGGNQVNTTLAPLLAPAALTATDEGTVAAPLAAPAPMALSAAPLRVEVINQDPASGPPITIQAGVIGNRNELDRIISKALRRHQRLSGSRN